MHLARMLSLALLWAALGVACSRGPQTPGAPAPLAPVSPLPSPSLPPWIVQISPIGSADENSQVRIRFANDIVPVEALESNDRQRMLDDFSLEPPVPGRFVIYTPRLVAYETDAQLPAAARFRVTLRAGLTDRSGHRLDHDLAWTFETSTVSLSDLPAEETDASPPVVDLSPSFTVNSNAVLDLGSLSSHAEYIPVGPSTAAPVPAVATEPSASPSPNPSYESDAEGARSAPLFSYELKPSSQLAAATEYKLIVHPGVMPAAGNIPSSQTFTGQLRVRGPLAFLKVETYERPMDSDGVGRFAGGAPQLDFSNPLDTESVKAAVHLSPAPKGPAVEANDGDTWLRIGSTALAPNTHYTITVDPTLKDTFGQTLGTTVTKTFDTTGFAADLWAPAGKNVFPSERNLQLNVYSTNLPAPNFEAAVRKVQPVELVDTEDAQPSDSSQPSLAPPQQAFAPVPVRNRSDAQTLTPIPLRMRLGGPTGMLAYGITGRTNRYRNDKGKVAWATPAFYGLVQLTDLGVFAQWFPHGGMVRVNHLADGSPAAGAQISVYESRVDASQFAGKSRPAAQPCATGTADATGALALSGAAFAPCAATSTSATDAPSLFVVARSRADWASVRTWPWSGGYDDGLNGGWSAGQPDSRGAIVSDRWMYQPGETAYFSGLAYFVTDGLLGRGRASSYALTLESPSGSKRSLGTATPDAFGVFAITLPLQKNQDLGYYTLHAKARNGEMLDGSFRVAEFKPPNFKVDLTLDRANAAQGTSVHATAKSDYLFGAPVSGGQAQIDVTRQRSYFTPPGYEWWEFGRVWLYPENEPNVSADVLQKSMPLEASGVVSFDVPVASDLPFAMAYRVDAQTTDVANVAVSDSKSFTAFPSDALIGLSGDFVATAHQKQTLKVIVVDPSGKPIEGRKLHAVLSRRTFARATQIVEGGETPHESAEYRTVDQADVTSGKDPQTITLLPGDPGDYRVRVNFAEAKSDTTASDHVLWVSGPGAADWGSASDNHVAVKLDKTAYKPGEIATVAIASPYSEAELDFAVIRSGVLYHERRIVKGTAPTVRFRVTEAMLPNASVEALLIRRGPSLAKGVPAGLSQLARIGFAAFTTALDAKAVKVKVGAQDARLEPGARQRLSVHLSDASGHPLQGEVALMVVNDAVLQLTGYRPPDLLKTVYAEQSISTRFADSRTEVALVSPERPVEKGYGYGGGFLPGAGDTRVRTNFKPVAYFNGALKTDSAGNALAQFTLPDDLTTWRVFVLAFGPNARFGNGEQTFITTKPLITNAVLPQFGRPGDTLDGGVSVTNTTKLSGSLQTQGTLSGGLAFVDGNATSPTKQSQVSISPGTAAYRFPMRVISPQEGRMQFQTTFGLLSDAFAVPLLVRTTDVLESAVQTGATKDHATVALDVSPSAPPNAGGLDVEVSSSIVPNIAEPVRRATDNDSLFSWSVSGRTDVLADSLRLSHTYQQTPGVSTKPALERAIAVLGTLRSAGGGISEWPGAKQSDPYLDALAFTALAHAKAAGSASAAAPLSRLQPALLRTLANPARGDDFKKDPARSEVRLATLAALAENGAERSDFLGEIYAQRDHLSVAERFVLARQLLRFPAWKSQAAALISSLQGTIAETARSAAVITSYAGVEEQSAALQLFVANKAPTDLLDRLLNSLLGLQRDGVWGCGCGDALALDALVAYASLASEPPNFTGVLQVGSAFQREFAFSGYRDTQLNVSLPMRDLHHGKQDVTLSKAGTGTLRYVVAYRYQVANDSPGRYQGLRLDRIVRPAGSAAPLVTFSLAAVAPVEVKPAQVFEVEDRIITDHPVDRVTVVDPLPAGMEAVDASLRTSSQAVQARADNWEIDYQQVYHDRVEAFASHLDPGVYALHYIVRSVTPGMYAWPAGEVYLERAPEEFGRTAMGRLTIAQQ